MIVLNTFVLFGAIFGFKILNRVRITDLKISLKVFAGERCTRSLSFIRFGSVSHRVIKRLMTLFIVYTEGMISSVLQVLQSLSWKEKILTAVILLLVWGGIVVAVTLSHYGIISDPGTFFWGCIAGTLVLSYLSLKKEKLDVVSLLTPVYAVIIFTALEIPPTLFLQILFAASITALVIRLHMQFSVSGRVE